MRIYFIFNIHAGKEKVKKNLADMMEVLCADGNEVVAHATQYPGEATELIENLPDGFDRVVCSGGDGTLDEVVAGMEKREEKIPIGYIPAGSTNDFAVSLGIPKNMKEAAKVALSSNIFDCDLGYIKDKPFTYVVAFGIFTKVSYATPMKLKNTIGYAAYLLEGAKSIKDVKSERITVEAKGKRITKDFLFGMITNSASVGGIKGITGKNVELNDGLFEVTLVSKPNNLKELGDVIVALKNRNYKAKGFYSFKTDKVKFISEEEVSYTRDGEFGGSYKEVELVNKKGHLKIAVN